MRLVSSPTARKLLTVVSVGLAAILMMPTTAVAAPPPAPGNFTGPRFRHLRRAESEGHGRLELEIAVQRHRHLRLRQLPLLLGQGPAQPVQGLGRSERAKRLAIHTDSRWLPGPPASKNNPKSKVQKKKMSSNSATARDQGNSDAWETVAALEKLGFGPGSVSYLDIEWYARTTACDNAVLEFADAWTERLHAQGLPVWSLLEWLGSHQGGRRGPCGEPLRIHLA